MTTDQKLDVLLKLITMQQYTINILLNRSRCT